MEQRGSIDFYAEMKIDSNTLFNMIPIGQKGLCGVTYSIKFNWLDFFSFL